MSEQYAKKEELNELRREMVESFRQTNESINSLAVKTNESIDNLTHEITSTIQKSMTSDHSLRTDFMREVENRDKERRQSAMRIAGLALTLIMAVWSAVWWAVNEHNDKTRINDKLEQCKIDHEIDKRILKLELSE